MKLCNTLLLSRLSQTACKATTSVRGVWEVIQQYSRQDCQKHTLVTAVATLVILPEEAERGEETDAIEEVRA